MSRVKILDTNEYRNLAQLKRDLFWINKIYWQTASLEIKKGDKRDNFEIDDFCGWLKSKIEESDGVVRVYEFKDFITGKIKLFIRKQNDFVAVAEFCKQSQI